MQGFWVDDREERRRIPAPPVLALKQIVQFASKVGVIEDTKPARNNCAVGIDERVLRLSGET